MKNIRTFVAVDVTEAVRERAAQLIEELRSCGGDIKWVEPHNMHLTLKFLGDVPETEVNSVCRAVVQAAADLPPFSISVQGVGAFPHVGRPRTVWIGVEEGAEQLGSLQRAVDRALKPLGYPKERRPFHAHLTLGRIRRGGPESRTLSDRLREQQAFLAGHSQIKEVVVYASYLDRSGPSYQAMSRGPMRNA